MKLHQSDLKCASNLYPGTRVNGVIDEVLENGQYQKWFDEYETYALCLGL